MRKALLATALLAITSGAYANDLGVRTTDTQKVDQDLSLMWKRNMGQTESEGKRKQKTYSRGRDVTSSKSDKESVSATRSGTASISVNLADLLSIRIAKLEKAGVEPFASCQLYSAPKLPRHFGLSAERRPGVIDKNRASRLTTAATSNMPVSTFDVSDQKIRDYGKCEAEYGAYLAQAFTYFGSDINALKATVSRGNNDNLSVDGLGYEDAVKLANAALDDALKTGPQGDILAKLNNAINDNGECLFSGSIEHFTCGANRIGIGGQPTMMRDNVLYYGVTITGTSPIYGLQANYNLQTGWSYQAALENIKQVGKFKRFAEDVSKYAEKAEQEGRTREAAYAKKKAIDKAVASDASLSAQAFVTVGHSIGGK